jgi:plasmid replication initiation protein
VKYATKNDTLNTKNYKNMAIREVKPRRRVNTLSIRKSNDLVEARYKFDIWETRLFTKMLSMIKSEDRGFHEYKIYVRDLIEDFGLHNAKNSYTLIREGAEKMMSKIIRVITKDDNEWVEFKTPIVGSLKSTLVEGENSYVKIGFHPDMRPFLLELKERYLVYDFKNVANLRSPYYVRIYELLKQYEKIGKRKFEIEELKDILGIVDEYKLYGHFKTMVIDKAQKNLLEYTDISFDYEEIKQGRAVTAVIFYISKNKPKRVKERPPTKQQVIHYAEYEEVESNTLQAAESPNLPPLTVQKLSDTEGGKKAETVTIYLEYYEKLNDWWGVQREEFLKRADGKTREDIDVAIAFTKSRIRLGKIENPAGLFLNALTKGFKTPEQHQTEKIQAQKEAKEREKREKQERLAALVIECNRLADAFADALNEEIKAITKEDVTVTEGAIERIKTQFRNMGDRSYDHMSVDDFRQNPFLRGLVKMEIQKMFPERFLEIREIHGKPLQTVESQIKMIDPNYKFDA